ncbi:amino acid permease-associated region [Granulicella sibirica]|uniref:Amino acid permease-associated region n=2 Tax=Granulicella sibirica TaxID=2479048 RepID=A0A4Q0SV28_9BACT|nr:amino acid permease-associated region [Granulicella sibirica]
MLDMIGVGPFITLPLILAAMGGPQAMLGWICGAVLALCDGMVWAELGAAIPAAGGTYRFLRVIYPGRVGRWLSFLFLFQLMVSAPLSVASGSIGLAQYAAYLFPQLGGHTAVHGFHFGAYAGSVVVGPGSLIAMLSVVVAVALLYRGLDAIGRMSSAMGVVVLGTIAWILVTGLLKGHIGQAFAFPAGAFRLDHGFFLGLGSAMLVATYDFWGYYNVTFLGGEVKDPERTIPRAILISIVAVGLIYLGMQMAVLAVLPWQPLLGAQGVEARRAVVSAFMEAAYGPSVGPLLGKIAAILVMVTAFASIFSLLLGYSRIPFAAARDGNFFHVFGRLHPSRGFPYVSLLALGGMALVFCWFSLGDVVAALVVLRICLQFLLQHVGVVMLRKRRPELRRPFRMWAYPLPALVGVVGFCYILFERARFERELVLAGVVACLGTAAYWVRGRVLAR